MMEPEKLSKEELAKHIRDYVVDYLKREKPWILLMDNEVLEFIETGKSGTINFSVRVYQRKTQDVLVEVLPSSETRKYTFIR